LSRNRDRVGSAKQPDASPPPQVLQNEGGGFAFVVPTEFVELPSQGKHYPEGHPLHGESTIEVKQMTAKEEDLLTSRALLKKGIALDRLIKSIIVDKSIDPNTLLVGDRNAILVAARVSGYGPMYQTKVTCPACAAPQDYEFDLNNALVYNGEGLREHDATQQEDGTYLTMLPSTRIEVGFRLLNGFDERNLLEQLENARKKRREENTITRHLKQIVVAVNGDTESGTINYVVDNMPSFDARHLRLMYKLATPNVDLTQNFVCNECDHEQEMEVPLTADFFWPDR